MFFDLIIVWWWASWLFCAINAPKNYKKLILEKQDQLWTKILLSGWWRCNFSNTNISPEKYFWQNRKMLASIFHKYSNQDFTNFLSENWVQYHIEDNGRIILKSGKAKELLDLLIGKTSENQTEIKLNQNIIKIEKIDEWFQIHTKDEIFTCKKLVIATWWVSFPQTGTTGFGIDLAKKFWIQTINLLPALCWLETQNDFSWLSGASIIWTIESISDKKIIYEYQWNILFTHRWLSGPAIFNTSAGIWEYLTKKWWNIKNIKLKISIESSQITKRLEKSNFLNSDNTIITELKNFRPLNEAKVSSGWISMDEIKPNFESKKIANLYFIWETLDIIGETWWFNLQRAWSSGFVCGNDL